MIVCAQLVELSDKKKKVSQCCVTPCFGCELSRIVIESTTINWKYEMESSFNGKRMFSDSKTERDIGKQQSSCSSGSSYTKIVKRENDGTAIWRSNESFRTTSYRDTFISLKDNGNYTVSYSKRY